MSRRCDVRLSASASRALAERLPTSVATAIWEFVIGPLADNPRRVGKALSGDLRGYYSARRGSYRVVYSISEDLGLISVVRIDHRRDVYRR